MAYTLRSGLPSGRIESDTLGTHVIEDGEVEVDDYQTAAALVEHYQVVWPDGDPGPPDDADDQEAVARDVSPGPEPGSESDLQSDPDVADDDGITTEHEQPAEPPGQLEDEPTADAEDADDEPTGDVSDDSAGDGDGDGDGDGEAAADTEPFNPSDYTLTELKSELEESDDDATAEELHEREREGDDRKGAHEIIDALRGSTAEADGEESAAAAATDDDQTQED